MQLQKPNRVTEDTSVESSTYPEEKKKNKILLTSLNHHRAISQIFVNPEEQKDPAQNAWSNSMWNFKIKNILQKGQLWKKKSGKTAFAAIVVVQK